jgi:hypothetical protein
VCGASVDKLADAFVVQISQHLTLAEESWHFARGHVQEFDGRFLLTSGSRPPCAVNSPESSQLEMLLNPPALDDTAFAVTSLQPQACEVSGFLIVPLDFGS